MAKGGSNAEANRLQRESLKLQKQQMKMMEKQMAAQLKQAKKMVLPKFEGAAPPPTASTADLEAVGQEQRLRAMRRQGLNSTVYAGAK